MFRGCVSGAVAGAMLAGLCAVSGCAVGTGRIRSSQRLPELDLCSIRPVDLQKRSQTEPVTVEEATGKLATEVLEAKPPAESIRLDIAQARADALANNLALKVQLVSPSIADQDVRAEEAQFEPKLFGLFAYDRRDGKSASDRTTLSAEPGLGIPLLSGGQVELSVPMTHDEFDRSEETDAAALRFSLSHSLLRNAGIPVNTASIRIADLERQATDALTKLRVINVLAATDRAYWRLYAARKESDVANQQYELAARQVERARKRVAAGAAPEIEVTRAESGLSVRLEGIIITRTTVWRRQRELKRIMNRDDLPIGSPVEIIPQTEPNPMGLNLDTEALVEQALDERMELAVLELELAINQEDILVRRNALLPKLDLDFVYDYGGSGSRLGEAFRRLGDDPAHDMSVALTAEVPLGNELAEARLRRTKLERLQRRHLQSERRLSIRQEVYDALDQLSQSWQQVVVARQGVIIAAKNYEAERRQFELGLRTSIEVLEAASRLAVAQLSEIRSLAAYEIAKVDLAVATGTLATEVLEAKPPAA